VLVTQFGLTQHTNLMRYFDRFPKIKLGLFTFAESRSITNSDIEKSKHSDTRAVEIRRAW
jgi:hypothetical protein